MQQTRSLGAHLRSKQQHDTGERVSKGASEASNIVCELAERAWRLVWSRTVVGDIWEELKVHPAQNVFLLTADQLIEQRSVYSGVAPSAVLGKYDSHVLPVFCTLCRSV